METPLFEQSSFINTYPEAGDTNAVALIKSSFRDGTPEAEKILNLASDTNLTVIVRNLALAEYVRRQELDLKRIKSIPAQDWERIDQVTYMATITTRGNTALWTNEHRLRYSLKEQSEYDRK